MKKQGYTLAEVLITVGIVGVLAALMLPLINKFRPDTTKILYLKTYDSVVETIRDIISDADLYPPTDNNFIYKEAPLYNLGAVEVDKVVYGGTQSKICQLMAVSLSSTGAGTCSDEYVAYNNALFANASFVNDNGVVFYVTTNAPNDFNNDYQTDVYFDVNGNGKGTDCMYNATCENPDRFRLSIGADGTVVAGDAMGQAYLNSRNNWKKTNVAAVNNLPSVPRNLRPEARRVYDEAPDPRVQAAGGGGEGAGGEGAGGEGEGE